jgi:hypothetical protein
VTKYATDGVRSYCRKGVPWQIPLTAGFTVTRWVRPASGRNDQNKVVFDSAAFDQWCLHQPETEKVGAATDSDSEEDTAAPPGSAPGSPVS